MSRLMVSLPLLLSAGLAAAQPPDPLDLARGLRENGLADLALEYLDDRAAANPGGEFLAVLPLERAQALLAATEDEPDAAARDGLTARAREELGRFLRANPNHPRGPEAAVALAGVTANSAKAALHRAAKIADDAGFKAAAAAARPQFEEAVKAFGQAAGQLAEQLAQPGLTPERKRQLTRELIRAELDRAITQYQISRTFVAPDATERERRGKALSEARKQFDELTDRYPGTAAASVARAWVGQCDIALDVRQSGERIFEEVKRDPSPQAAAGKRMVRFFEARLKFEDALTRGRPQDLGVAKAAAAEWLRDFGRRPSPETAAVRYQLAYLKQREAEAQLREDPKTKQPIMPPAALTLLRDAERDYRRLTESDNEFTERAVEQRNKVIRLIIGDAEIDPARVASFEEAVMAASVQFDRALREPGGEQSGRLTKAIRLLERAVALPVPAESRRDLTEAQLRLAFAYLLAERPYEAAILGEHLARTARPGSLAARGGTYALRAYLAAANKLPPDDATGKQADRGRAAELARFLDRTYPTDPATDDARIMLGQILTQDGQPREAFEVLGRVSPTHPKAAVARLMAGSAIFDLLRAAPDRADLASRLADAIRAVPDPPSDAPSADAESFARMKLLLAQVHLTRGPAGFPDAARAASDAKQAIKKLEQLPEPSRQALDFQAEETRLRAVVGQLAPLFRQQKYSEALDRIEPEVTRLDKSGPAAKPDQEPTVADAAKRLDDFRRADVLTLALRAAIRAKDLDRASRLFDLQKRFGGGPDAGVQALAQLVSGVRPEVETLRRDGKPDDAAELLAGLGQLIDRVLAEPNLTPAQRVYLGRALKDIGKYDRAAELLRGVPAPPAGLLNRNPNELEGDDRLAVLLYRGAHLELAETLRLAGDFPAAEAVLRPAIDEKSGWAKNAPNFRKEALYLIEARAAAANPAEAQKLWAEALAGWNKFAAEYRALLARPLPPVPPPPEPPAPDAPAAARAKYQADLQARAQADQRQADARRQKETTLKPLYFDAFHEVQRCIVAGNAHLLRSNPDRLAQSLDKVAATLKQVEDANPDLTEEVRAKFSALVNQYPDLRARYAAKGGTAFLTPTEPNQ